MEEKKYEILGVHELDSGEQVARIRMFVDGKAVDEDLVFPRVITIEEQIESAAKKRIAEFSRGVTAEDSNLTVGDGDQVINTEYTPTERGYDV